ncbi:MAG: HAMP domain-containing sensor histidine kinase [Methylovirgula sp.]
MAINDIFRSAAFRVALVFALVVTASTSAVFGFVYWQVAASDTTRLRAILVDEATKAALEPTAQLEPELARRLTGDLRQMEYVGLFDATDRHIYGNVTAMPPIPADGAAHLIEMRMPNGGPETEPLILVAQRRPDGGVLLLGRSLYEIYALRHWVLQALAIGIVPAILLALLAGAVLSLRASRRLQSIRYAIDRIIHGNLQERLPVHRRPDDIDDVVRGVNLMLDEIIRLMNQVRTVGDDIAHDLRTPLSIVRARLERGLASAAEKELRAASQQALADLDRALATVTALLRISEIESGLRRSAFQKVDLSEVCREVFEFYEPVAEAKSISMNISAPQPVPITGDAELLREALANLVDNAIKFTPQGGAVSISARPDGPSVRVADTGPGIAASEREKIFQRFYRSAEHGGVPGHGLGLSMAAMIAELHGFALRLDKNAPGAAFEMAAKRIGAEPQAAEKHATARTMTAV